MALGSLGSLYYTMLNFNDPYCSELRRCSHSLYSCRPYATHISSLEYMGSTGLFTRLSRSQLHHLLPALFSHFYKSPHQWPFSHNRGPPVKLDPLKGRKPLNNPLEQINREIRIKIFPDAKASKYFMAGVTLHKDLHNPYGSHFFKAQPIMHPPRLWGTAPPRPQSQL